MKREADKMTAEEKAEAKKARNRANCKRYYDAHREEICAKTRERRLKNIDGFRERKREYSRQYRKMKSQDPAWIEKERARKRAWRKTESGRRYSEKTKKYQAAYRKSERGREVRRLWLEKNKDKMNEWWAKNKDKYNDIKRQWRITNHEKVKEYRKKWATANHEYLCFKARLRQIAISERCEVDAEFYAQVRQKDRVRAALKNIKEGKPYIPNINNRIPDWATKGMDYANFDSPFLRDNIKPEQKDFIYKLNKEKRERKRRKI